MPAYTERDIDRLIEGAVWDPVREEWAEVEPAVTWMGQRSWVERTGRVDSQVWLEVLDVERAIDQLRNCGCKRGRRCAHKAGALVLTATLHQWPPEELQEVFGALRMDWRRALDKGIAFILAYLNAGDVKAAEKAWRAERRLRER